jgi:diguanylate cyclase (GGDEF)-like protein
MRRVAVTMFVVGGLTAALGVLTTEATPASRLAQGECAAAFVLCGIVVFALRPGRRGIEVAVATSILVLGLLMARSNPLGMGPLFFLWPMVYAAYFFTVRVLLALSAWMVANLGVGLFVNPHLHLKVDTFTGTLSSVGLMTALVAVMNRREAQLRAKLALAAETDPLTGLLNRRAFDPLLAGMIATAVAKGTPLSVAMFDADHFKDFNDRHGHLAGDDALRRIAGVLVAESRHGDGVARLGSEEFAVALPGADTAAAMRYAERVARVLRGPLSGVGVRLSISAGIAPLADDAHTMLARADEALYAAKRAGRARTAWWNGHVEVGEPLDAASADDLGMTSGQGFL